MIKGRNAKEDVILGLSVVILLYFAGMYETSVFM
jgi:hypothetical protein